MSDQYKELARDQWSERLSAIMTPYLCEGIKSIFNKALRVCEEENEPNEYLKTFQKLLANVSAWSPTIVREEVARIEEKSGCTYLSEMVTGICVSRVRMLSNGRAGPRQKGVTISVPPLDLFVHKVYINIARKIYMHTFLFEQNISPIQKQKNDRNMDRLVAQCVYETVWDFIPEKELLRALLSEDQDHVEEITYETIEAVDPAPKRARTDEDFDSGSISPPQHKRSRSSHDVDSDTEPTLQKRTRADVIHVTKAEEPEPVFTDSPVEEPPVDTDYIADVTDAVLEDKQDISGGAVDDSDMQELELEEEEPMIDMEEI